MKREQGEQQVVGAAHLGYALAVLVPIIGLLVGLALIARDDEDGPWIVGYSVAVSTLYAGVVAARLTGAV